jgi:membrane-associated protease RseP (regulator of RpoE activity)
MKSFQTCWHIPTAIIVVLLQSSCALLPSLPLGSFTFTTGQIGIEHIQVGVRGIFPSSKLKSVIIDAIEEGSIARQAGIIPGDELLSVDGVKIRSLSFEQFKTLLAERAVPHTNIAFEVISPGAKVSRIAIVVVPAKTPNKAPEPTPGSVTPRATVGD